MSLIAEALNGGGGQYLKWETPGTSYTGTITEVTLRQSRKFESTDLDTWDDGSPKMQIVLALATDYRDPINPDDEGNRQLSINLWSGQKKSLVAACKAAGVTEPQVGQVFTATHVSGIGTAKAPRVFEYKITPAPTGIAAALGEAPATKVETAAPAAANPAETAQALLKAGLDVEQVAAGSGLPLAVVQALANANA